LTDVLDFLAEAADEDRSSVEYRLQAHVLDVSERVHARIRQLGISQAEVARRMGVSRPMITKLLTGDSNFQLRTLLRLADALDMDLMVDLVPEGFRLPRFYVSRAASAMGAYTQLSESVSGQRLAHGHAPKKEIVLAGGAHATSDYTVPRLVKVA
jgi:transcriptional regulator with XRE-family HTH domain